MQYLEIGPIPANAGHIKKYWMMTQAAFNGDILPEPILPDGCVEVIFDLSDRFMQFHDDGRVELQPRTMIAGQISRRILIAPTGKTDLFGIRFHPAGALPLIGGPIHELNDLIIDAALVLGKDEALLFEMLSEHADLNTRARIFDLYFQKRLSDKTDGSHTAGQAAGLILDSNGLISVTDIAATLNLSERTIERLFREYVGISPKLFSRIARFQSFLRSVENSPQSGLLDLAIEAGYYDQSHMIREFRSFTRRSPTEFFGRENVISDLFVAGQ